MRRHDQAVLGENTRRSIAPSLSTRPLTSHWTRSLRKISVVKVGPSFSPPPPLRGDGKIETRIAEISAVTQNLAQAQRPGVAEFSVGCRALETEGYRLSVGIDAQEAHGVAVHEVEECVELGLPLEKAALPYPTTDPASNLEWATPGVCIIPLAPEKPPLKDQPAAAVWEVVIDPRVDFRRRTARVLKSGVGRPEWIRNKSRRARKRVLGGEPR